MTGRNAIALGVLVLATLLIAFGNAQARDVYCAPDNEASNLNGRANPIPFPVGMFNFSSQKSKTEAWNVANQTTANAADRKRPVTKHEWLQTKGHYAGAYTYVSEQPDCHAYVLDPNATFGHWTALVAGDTVQTWEAA
jgi:hypothetical protein